MTWEQLFEEIKKDAVRNVYLFSGQEEYIKAQAVSELMKKFLPEGLEVLNYTDLENPTAEDIIETAETLPFMCDKRLFIARDYAPLLPGKAKDEANETERLLAYLPKAPDTCCIVFFVRGDVDGRKKLTTQFAKMDCHVKFDLLDDAHISTWVKNQLKPYGKAMEKDAVQQLIFMAGRNLTTLEGEVAKLASYVGERASITAKDVEKIVTPMTEYTVFQMIDKVMEGDVFGAHALLRSSLERGESPIGMIAMLTRQMRMLTHICVMQDGGAQSYDIAKKLELAPFVAKNAQRQARRFTADSAKAGYVACVDADYSVKTGRVRDEEALNGLMLMLPGLIKK